MSFVSSQAILPRRVVVLGVTGSGKTTAAAQVARLIDAKHIELDALYHGPNWTPPESTLFRERVRMAIDGCDCWTTDGGYASLVWDITWARADTIVWLDYPLWLSVIRLFRRTIRRVVTREELWNGNRESLRNHFASRDSLFLWAVTSHKKYEKSYPAYFARPELAQAQVLRFRSAGAFASWLGQLRAATDGK